MFSYFLIFSIVFHHICKLSWYMIYFKGDIKFESDSLAFIFIALDSKPWFCRNYINFKIANFNS